MYTIDQIHTLTFEQLNDLYAQVVRNFSIEEIRAVEVDPSVTKNFDSVKMQHARELYLRINGTAHRPVLEFPV